MTIEELVKTIQQDAKLKRSGANVDAQELDKLFKKHVQWSPSVRHGEGFRKSLEELRQHAAISHEPPEDAFASMRPGASFLKRRLWRLFEWLLRPIAERVGSFNRKTVETLHLAADRIDESEVFVAQISEMPAVTRQRVEAMWQMWEKLGGIRMDERLTRVERMIRYLSQTPARGSLSHAQDLPEQKAPAPSQAPRKKLEKTFDYYLFQMAHRGGPEMLEERIRRYLPHFEGTSDVLDFGCGKGEFIEAFQKAGISARGVEIHPDMVADCQERGLDVVEADGLEYLSGLEEGSLGGIFLGQVIEHLNPEELVKLVDLSRDVLRPGGVFLAETVNPTTLGSFSHAFYIDLSHNNPIHPTTMRFLLEAAGFADITYEWMFPFDEETRLSPIPSEEPWAKAMDANIEKLNKLLYGPHDYAVVARKPS